MLDLKKLEQKIDEALEKETSETLKTWLFEQRENNLKNFLGLGSFYTLKATPYTFYHNNINIESYKNSCNSQPNSELAKAA